MCVIAICKTRKLTITEIEKMNDANPHGIGIAWLNGRTKLVEYTKGLTVDEAITRIAKLPLPQVVHFRYASVGAITPALAHPFPLTLAASLDLAGAAPAVLFHNGTWVEWKGSLESLIKLGEYIDPHEPWSDSRVMAALMARVEPGKVATIVGQVQRLAVLRGTGQVELYGDFVKHQGLLVSNLWWTAPPKLDFTPAWLDEEDETDADEDDDEAPLCAPPRRKAARSSKGKGKTRGRGKKRRQKLARAPQASLFTPDVNLLPSRYFPRVPRPVTPSYRGR